MFSIRILVVLCAFAAGLAASVSVQAQDNLLRWYRTSDGLPHDQTETLQQDARGNLWIGTFAGMCRYDGHRFEHMRGAYPRLARNPVSSSCLDSTGLGVWFATAGDVFHVSADGALHRLFRQREGGNIPIPGVVSLQLDRAKRLWIGTTRTIFSLHPREGWRDVLRDAGIRPRALGSMVLARGGAEVWVVNGARTVLKYDVAHRRVVEWDVFETETDDSRRIPGQRVILTMVSDVHTGVVWIVTTVGCIVLDGPAAAPRILPSPNIGGYYYFHPTMDRDGNLWRVLDLPHEAEYRYCKTALRDGTTLATIRHEDFGRMLPFGCILEDRDGGVWIGSDGLSHVRDPSATTYAFGSEHWVHVPRNAVIDGGNLLISTWGGVYRIHGANPESLDFLTASIGVPGASTSFVMPAPRGYFWYQGVRTLAAWRDGRVSHLRSWPGAPASAAPPENTARLSDGSVVAVHPVSRRSVLRITERGVSEWLTVGAEDVLDPTTIFTTQRYNGRRDDVFLASASRLIRVRDGRIEKTFGASQGYRGGTIVSLCEDSSAGLWAAVSGSDGMSLLYLIRTDTLRRYEPSQLGLPYSRITAIEAHPDGGGLCIGTDDGLFLVDPRARRVLRRWTRADGLNHSSIIGIHFLPDSVMWVLTPIGMTRLPDRGSRPRTAMPVFVTRIVVNDSITLPARPGARTEFAERPSRITFSFTTTAFDAAPVFSTLLDGYDGDWSAPSDAHTREFTNLEPGEYTFRVRAIDASGRRVMTEAAVLIDIPPPIYQTWWFIFAANVLVILLVWAVYRYRLSNILRIENMRRSIAIDLHDEIGSTLTSISIMSAVTRGELAPGQSEVAAKLTRIGETTRSVIGLMSDIIWSLHPENDSVDDLRQRLDDMLDDIGELHGIDTALVCDERLHGMRLQQDVRRNFYLIAREALHNAVKHARCTRIDVALSRDERLLTLRVADNGSGFTAEQHRGGTGMRSMNRRASEIGAEIRITSGHGDGTVITVRVPEKGVLLQPESAVASKISRFGPHELLRALRRRNAWRAAAAGRPRDDAQKRA